MLDDILAELVGKFIGDSAKNKYMGRWLILIFGFSLLIIIFVIFLMNN